MDPFVIPEGNDDSQGGSSEHDYANVVEKLSLKEAGGMSQSHLNRWASQQNTPVSYYSDDYGTQSESSILRRGWRVICIRKRLIVLVTAVISLLVTLLVYSTKPKYQATATIELGKENASLIQISKDVIIHNDDSIKTKKFLLQSTPLLETVVLNLRLDRKPDFLSTEKNWFSDVIYKITGKNDADDRNGVSSVTAETDSAQRTDRPYTAEDHERRSAEQTARLEPFVKVLTDNLTVEEIRDTRLLNVSFTHTDRVLAAAVANGVVQALIQSTFETKSERFNTASTWLDRQTHELRAKVDQAEQELAAYTRAHNVISNDGSETVISDKLSRLHGETLRAESDRILKQSLYDEVRNGNVDQLPEAFTNPATVELKTKLNELTTKAAQLSVNYGPDNPQTTEVQQQIAAVEKQTEANKRMLEAKLKADYERAVRDEQSLKQVLNQATNEAVQKNQTAMRFSILKQQFETSKALYADFLQKTSQANFEASQQDSNLRIIQPALVPKETKPPKRWEILVLGLALSLGTGVGAAFVVEKLDNRINTPEQLKRYVQLPAIGIIPPISKTASSLKKQKRLAITSAVTESYSMGSLNGQSAAAEAYRVLRTSVLLSPVGSVPKTILFTSSQPGDGKTTTTVNTAVSLAQLGSSVLIVDCDLRTPRVHELLDVDQSPGVSTFLSSELKVEDVIRLCQIPGLSVLTAGSVANNPSELFSSDKLKQMLSALSKLYDHILIDSPPLINLADPLILSTLVDGVILVVDGSKTTCDIALRAREELLSVGANIFGVVLNKFDSRRKTYGYY